MSTETIVAIGSSGALVLTLAGILWRAATQSKDLQTKTACDQRCRECAVRFKELELAIGKLNDNHASVVTNVAVLENTIHSVLESLDRIERMLREAVGDTIRRHTPKED